MGLSSIHSSRVETVFLIILTLSLFPAACGTDNSSDTMTTSKIASAPDTSTAPETTVDKKIAATEEIQEMALRNCPEAGEAFVQDAESYAEDYKVSDEEAVRRMRLQECYAVKLANLERELSRKESDSFAGLWIEHRPEYRFVILFTENGQQTIRPYTKGASYTPLLKIRSDAEATLQELREAQKEAGHLVDRLDLKVNSGLNIQENRAELYVVDRLKTANKIEKSGRELPEHVVLVKVDSLLRLS